MTETTIRKHWFSYHQDALNGNRWQVRVRQYPDGVTPMWFDAGDAVETRQEAEAKMAEFMAADKGLRQRDDGRWEPNE